MKKQFGNIPEEVLGIEINVFEELEPKTLAYLIQEVTSDPIVSAKYTIVGSKKGLDISSFVAYTDTHWLTLMFTPVGHYMLYVERKYLDETSDFNY